MYLSACLLAYCLTYLHAHLPACLPTDYVVHYECLHMLCCVWYVGPHGDSFINAIEDKTNTRYAQRLLESVTNKDMLVDFFKVICRCQIWHGLICIFFTYIMVHAYYINRQIDMQPKDIQNGG